MSRRQWFSFLAFFRHWFFWDAAQDFRRRHWPVYQEWAGDFFGGGISEQRLLLYLHLTDYDLVQVLNICFRFRSINSINYLLTWATASGSIASKFHSLDDFFLVS